MGLHVLLVMLVISGMLEHVHKEIETPPVIIELIQPKKLEPPPPPPPPPPIAIQESVKVVEDVTEIILNLKQVRFKKTGDSNDEKVIVKVKGKKEKKRILNGTTKLNVKEFLTMEIFY